MIHFPFTYRGIQTPLARVLSSMEPGRPWETLMHAGHVLVFGHFVGAGYQAKDGDQVEYQDRVEEPVVCTDWRRLWEDADFIAVDKPANLPVHPTGAYREHCLVRLLEKELGPVHPIHRLDRETSGVLLLAKNPAAAKAGHLSFHQNRKTYLAAVHGAFPSRLTVDLPLGPKPGSKVRMRQGMNPEGQASRTLFARVRSAAGLSLVMAWPETGRKHQIRAHLAESGFAVVGDKIYGLDEGFFIDFIAGELKTGPGTPLVIDRHFLHCWKIRFRHPILDRMVLLKSPLPPELRALADKGIL